MYVTIFEIEYEFDVSEQMVINVLAKNNLYDSMKKQPTKFAIKNKLARIERSRSVASGKTYINYFWDSAHIKNIFPKFTKIEKANQCQTSEYAHARICDAFSDFSIILKIEQQVQNNGISEAANTAAIQCYFGETRFFNGVRLLRRFFSPEEVENAKSIILPLANELYAQARKVSAARAKQNIRAVEIVLEWLRMKSIEIEFVKKP